MSGNNNMSTPINYPDLIDRNENENKNINASQSDENKYSKEKINKIYEQFFDQFSIFNKFTETDTANAFISLQGYNFNPIIEIMDRCIKKFKRNSKIDIEDITGLSPCLVEICLAYNKRIESRNKSLLLGYALGGGFLFNHFMFSDCKLPISSLAMFGVTGLVHMCDNVAGNKMKRLFKNIKKMLSQSSGNKYEVVEHNNYY